MPAHAIVTADFKPRPMESVARSFAGKAALTSRDFNLLKAESRARAFRMAGINKASLIQSAQNEIRKALRDGVSYRDLQNRLVKIFGQEGVEALPTNHLRIIMRQNMLTAYGVARKRFLEQPAVIKRLPFWEYLTVADSGVRRDHKALHGKVFRADDPVWKRVYPPWDWGCRCSIRALDGDEVKERGGEGRIVVNGQQELEDNGIVVPPEFDFDRDQLFERAELVKIDAAIRGYVEKQFSDAETGFQHESRAVIGPEPKPKPKPKAKAKPKPKAPPPPPKPKPKPKKAGPILIEDFFEKGTPDDIKKSIKSALEQYAKGDPLVRAQVQFKDDSSAIRKAAKDLRGPKQLLDAESAKNMSRRDHQLRIHAKILVDAVEKSDLAPVPLYRGMGMPEGGVSIGQSVDGPIQSFTGKKNVAEFFSRGEFDLERRRTGTDERVIFKLEPGSTPAFEMVEGAFEEKGVKGLTEDQSGFKDEDEWVVDGSFVITKITKVEGEHGGWTEATIAPVKDVIDLGDPEPRPKPKPKPKPKATPKAKPAKPAIQKAADVESLLREGLGKMSVEELRKRLGL